MKQAFRSMQIMVILLVLLVGAWVTLPWICSIFLVWWLQQQGYEQVEVQVGLPGLRSMSVPRLALASRLTGEMVTVSLTNAQAEYTLL